MLALPETDGALIYTQSGAKGPLGQPRQNPGGAELAACERFLLHVAMETSIPLVTRHVPPPRWRSRSV